MSRKKGILLADAVVNLLLGVLLVGFNPGLAETLGVPASDTRFYPSILGAVFIGVTLALVVEALRSPGGESAGLGLVGAICINLCGGVALGLWLSLGDLNLPLRGSVLLWSLVAGLIVLSGLELVWSLAADRRTSSGATGLSG